jgi:hypothetical protein
LFAFCAEWLIQITGRNAGWSELVREEVGTGESFSGVLSLFAGQAYPKGGGGRAYKKARRKDGLL